MQPLDINNLDARVVDAIKNNNPDPIEDVLNDLSNRIHLATNPLSSVSAPLVLLTLRLYIKMINDMSPGANIANTYLKLEIRRLNEQLLLAQDVSDLAQQLLNLALKRLQDAEADNRVLRAKLQQYEGR